MKWLVKQAILWHRYLGIFFSLFFAIWFLSGIVMIVMIALAALGMRRLAASGAALTEELVFEEAYPAEVTSLGLN